MLTSAEFERQAKALAAACAEASQVRSFARARDFRRALWAGVPPP